MNRRDFIKTMIAASAAPAIVKAESLMKVYAPARDIILPEQLIGPGGNGYLGGFFLVENELFVVASSKPDGPRLCYRNGILEISAP